MMIANLGPRESYQIVQIRIFTADVAGGDYPVEMSVLRWRDFPRAMLHLDQAGLDASLLDPPAYGMALGNMLFADPVIGKPYAETIAAVQAQGHGLRIRLLIDPPELQGLHWERIYYPLAGEWHPLGSMALTPFSRYVRAQQWDTPAPIPQRPLKLLAVIASPAALDQYGLDTIAPAERGALHITLDALPDVQVTYLESGSTAPPTMEGLRKALADGYHLVHFLCHGARTPGGTVLYLEKADGAVDPVEAGRLVTAFKAVAKAPALCFLAACESAGRQRNDAFVPLAPALVEDGGVQAVVAMIEKVGIRTAQDFAGQFYERLLYHGMVDLAANEARALVQDTWDWGAPVLFSRLQDNQVIDFPIRTVYNNYFSHSDTAFSAAGEALQTVRRLDHGQQLVSDLEKLIKELGKGHQLLADLTDPFRRTGRDAATFPKLYEDFYYHFKQQYDQQTWMDQDMSCREIRLLRARIMPQLAPLWQGDPATLQQLDQELDGLSDADGRLLHIFQEYLETMNDAVEQIWSTLSSRNVDEAIKLKLAFEAQISPSLRRSKDTLRQMSNSVTAVAAA